MNTSKQIIEICNRLFDRGLIAPLSGNISFRNSKDEIIITPSRMRKFQLSEKDLSRIDLKGKVLSGKNRPSSEYRIHAKIYKERKDIKAIIHAHPQYAITCSLAAITFESPILPETALSLGSIPTIPFAPPGSDDLAESIVPFVKDHNAFILERHGAIAISDSLWEAYDRIEEIEHAAKIAYLLSLKGRVPVLGRSQLLRIVNYAEGQGLPIPDFAKKLLFRILAK